jgi:hypothetical protein
MIPGRERINIYKASRNRFTVTFPTDSIIDFNQYDSYQIAQLSPDSTSPINSIPFVHVDGSGVFIVDITSSETVNLFSKAGTVLEFRFYRFQDDYDVFFVGEVVLSNAHHGAVYTSNYGITISDQNIVVNVLPINQGPPGLPGEQGPPGAPLNVVGELNDETELPIEGESGEAYIISGDLYVWSSITEQFVNVGAFRGPQGEVGPGVPIGGTVGQSLVKSTNINYETEWVDREPAFEKNTAFNKNFGSIADTVTEGNDSRLSNSREWTADTISQTEVETGTGTTRRAWTAQRVWQAITAWWDELTVEISKISGLADALAGKEPTFTKNTAFNKDFGSTTGTVTEGDDVRLSDARTPTTHSHTLSDITDSDDLVIEARRVSITTKSAAWTFSLAEGDYYRFTGASNVNATVPQNSSVAYPIGTVITIRQAGNGVVTLLADTNVILNGDLKTAGQDKNISAVKLDTNLWDIVGGVA